MSGLSLTVFAFAVLLASASAAPSCLSPGGYSVDWWVVMKAPYDSHNSDPSVASGYAYAYMDSESLGLGLQYSGARLDAANGPVAKTLQASVYAGKDIAYLMYNDESPPDGPTYGNYAHSKGVLAGGAGGGFWLVHSVPRWPIGPSSGVPYTFPDNEKRYGQSMLCMSLGEDMVNAVAGQFLITKPHVYDSALPGSVKGSYPNVGYVMGKQWVYTPTSKHLQLRTLGGETFHHLAKNAQLEVSLYEDVVQPFTRDDMMWETWMNGNGGKQPAFCRPDYQWECVNVQSVQLAPGVSWPETKDHSKWGVSIPNGAGSGNWACIGDINRQHTQYRRGGGTVCISDPSFHQALARLVVTAQSC